MLIHKANNCILCSPGCQQNSSFWSLKEGLIQPVTLSPGKLSVQRLNNKSEQVPRASLVVIIQEDVSNLSYHSKPRQSPFHRSFSCLLSYFSRTRKSCLYLLPSIFVFSFSLKSSSVRLSPYYCSKTSLLKTTSDFHITRPSG